MSTASRDVADLLAALSAGDPEVLEEVLVSAGARSEAVSLGPRTAALVSLAALIALDAPPAAYADAVATAVEAGASLEEIGEVLVVLAPTVGAPRLVAAAPELMLALGMPLPGTPDREPPLA